MEVIGTAITMLGIDMAAHAKIPQALSRDEVLRELKARFAHKEQPLVEAIEEKQLYFRVSLVGNCNLSCPFCHNEGAPTHGRAEVNFTEKAIFAAAQVGYRRVQFTGGEPLLHTDIARFVRIAKQCVPDVGVTTNGTLLGENIESLVAAGISKIHVSLQEQALRRWGVGETWGVPPWLQSVLSMARAGHFALRLNMPIPTSAIEPAFGLIESLEEFGCDVKVFSILPERGAENVERSLQKLIDMVDRENSRRCIAGSTGRIYLRGYRAPRGLRCGSCKEFHLCKEQSHSLRLGADRILRPCLATRDWDAVLAEVDMVSQIRDATVFALDY